MKIGIRYETIYRYDRAVRFSPHDVRLFPRTDRFLQIARLDFQTKPKTTVRFGRDVFDNVVASCFFDQPSEMLELRLALDVEATKKNPFDFVLSRRVVQMPFNYEEDIASIICAYCKRQSGESISLPGWRPPSRESPRETVATLVELTKTLHRTISYERREEGAALAVIPRYCWRKCCVILVWQRESSPDICVKRMRKFVVPKARCMRGRKFFCPVPVGLDWTPRMVFFAMIISLPPRSDYGRQILRRSAEVFTIGIASRRK